MDILKTSLRIVFLVLLCIPIIYIEYYIIKTTMSDVMKLKKKSSKTNNTINNHYGKEYMKIAK
ncbi:hypothetical protein [Wukongibacter baidiensis]